MQSTVKPLFASIIVPVYNAERWLKECIDSILAQSDRDFELILIDDGSSDHSGTILDSYAESDPERIRVIHQTNHGVSHARNTGISLARGEFLLFVDADDLVHPQLVEMLKTAETLTHSDCYYWNYLEFEDSVHFEPLQDHSFEIRPRDHLIADIFDANKNICGYLWNKAFRRLCTQDIRMDEDVLLQEDLLYVCRVLASNPSIACCKLDMPLYGYRQFLQSATHSPFSFSQLTTLSARDRMVKLLNNGSAAEKKAAAILAESLPLYICVINKKLLLKKISKRKQAFCMADKYWELYASYAKFDTWSVKEKLYYLLQKVCYKLRRMLYHIGR